jgi:hypothetical protein
MPDKNVKKYLENYAEPEVKALHRFPQRTDLEDSAYEHVIVIPAYKESDDFIRRFIKSKLVEENVLLIIVINQPDTDFDKSPQESLHKQIGLLGKLTWQNRPLNLISLDNSSCDVLLVDRFTKAIPQEQGVGLARKLGVDLAVVLHDKGLIRSLWIHSTDADATLPDHYFEPLKKLNNCVVAACYNFNHSSNNMGVHQATQQYETALRYYVAGLHYAKSSYAFFTIGSTLTFRTKQYCMVRGFPKRSAGEDFYLLNKIAKLGAVDFFKDTIIEIDARTSDRVPFGTGPAVNKILSLTENNDAYCYYHPSCFDFLKIFLSASDTLWLSKDNVTSWFETLPVEIIVALTELNFTSFVNKQRKVSQQQFNRQVIVWFDAFKTLKFIHAIRRQGYDDMPLCQGIKEAVFSIK